MIEHIEYQKAAQFVREVYRILRPGGKFRAATPDLRFVIELYGEVKNDARQEYISWMFNQLHDFDVELDSVVINYLMRGFTPAHKFIYDFKTLKMLLVKNGFSDIISYGPGESDDEQLKGVEGHGRMVPRKFNDMETLVVECTKPELVT
jgi:SAM-dependent methyltransferase